VNRQVDFPLQQSLLNFLGKETFPGQTGQALIGNPVGRGADHPDLNRQPCPLLQ
jgi:hypothetical protein